LWYFGLIALVMYPGREKLCQHLDVKVGVTEEIEGGKVHVHVFK